MARANNTSRSLIIASKLMGWDPTKIEGESFANGSYPETRPTEGDSARLHGPLPSSEQSERPEITVDTPVTFHTPKHRR